MPRTPSRSPRKRPLLPAMNDAASLFDPSSLPLPKVHRAWERQAQSPYNKEKGRRKVWRRYGVNKSGSAALEDGSAPESVEVQTDESEEMEDGGMKIKRMRVASPERRQLEESLALKKRAHLVTKWDRRRSVLPRKQRADILEEEEPTKDIFAAEDSENFCAGIVAQHNETKPNQIASDTPRSSNDQVEYSVQTVGKLSPDSDGIQRSLELLPPIENAIMAPDEENHQGSSSNEISVAQSSAEVTEAGKLRRRTRSPRKRTSRSSLANLSQKTPAKSPVSQHPILEPIDELSIPTALEPVQQSVEGIGLHNSPASGEDSSVEQVITLEQGSAQASTTSELHVSQHSSTLSTRIDASTRQPDINEVPRLDVSACEDVNIREETTNTFPEGSPSVNLPAGEPLHSSKDNLDMYAVTSLETTSVVKNSPTDDTLGSTEATIDLEANILSERFTFKNSPQIATKMNEAVSNTALLEPDVSIAPEETKTGVDAVEEDQDDEEEEDSPTEDSENSITGDDITEDFTVVSAPPEDTLTLEHARMIQGRAENTVDPEADIEESASIIAASTNSPSEEFTSHLDYDTALLKDFLNRNAANKANKATSIARRSSLQNRRDSDAVRQALASSLVLEEKDTNSPAIAKTALSSKELSSSSRNIFADMDLDKPSNQSKSRDEQANSEASTGTERRRSSRARTTRLPAAPQSSSSSLPVPAKISVRSVNGTDVVELQKDESAQRNALVRANTKRNKMGATPAPKRLKKLELDNTSLLSTEEGRSDMQRMLNWERILGVGQKGVRWKTELVQYQEFTAPDVTSDPEQPMSSMEPAEILRSVRRRSVLHSEATIVEQRISPPLEGAGNSLSMSETLAINTSAAAESSQPKNQTSRVRRARGLGTVNGTPAKGLLASAELLPDTESKEAKLLTKERKSRLAVPRKTKLPTSSSAIPKPSKAAAEPPSRADPQTHIAASVATQPPISSSISMAMKQREGQIAVASNEQENRLLSPKNLLSPRKRPRSVAFSASTTASTSSDLEEKVPSLMLSPKRALSPRKKGFSSSTTSIFPGTSEPEESAQDKDDRRMLSPKRLMSPRKKLFAAGDSLSSSIGSVSALNFGASLMSSSDAKMSGLMSPAKRPTSPKKRAAGMSDMRKRTKR